MISCSRIKQEFPISSIFGKTQILRGIASGEKLELLERTGFWKRVK